MVRCPLLCVPALSFVGLFLPLQSRAFVILAVLALLPAAAVLAQGSARLLVHKSLDHHASMPHNFALNAPINVSLTLINAGDATAYDVVLEDSWGQSGMFEVEAGKGTGPYKFDEIIPGQAVNVQYFVEPKQTGPFESSPARVLYKATAGGATQVSSDSPQHSGQRAQLMLLPASVIALTFSVAFVSADRLLFVHDESQRDRLCAVRQAHQHALTRVGAVRWNDRHVRPGARVQVVRTVVVVRQGRTTIKGRVSIAAASTDSRRPADSSLCSGQPARSIFNDFSR